MQKDIRKRIKEVIEEMGYEIGYHGFTNPTHHNGLPNRTWVPVKPNFSPRGDGCVVIVTPTTVERYTISTPYAYNEWHKDMAMDYNTQKELNVALFELALEPKGMWG